MSKGKKTKAKTFEEIKRLFADSDEDLDSLNGGVDSCINYTTDFDKWTVHHYYAMKKREKFPNMFFYYFPRSLFYTSKMNEIDKIKVIDYIFNNKDKNINGKWGYLSLIVDNGNINGAELFISICNNREIIDLSNSFPLKEDAEPDFDESIKLKVDNILESKKVLYNKVLEDFENYLKEQRNEEVKKRYYNFVKYHEDMYIYCDKNKNTFDLIEGIIDINNNNKDKINQDENLNNNIALLPKDYNEKNNGNINKDKKEKKKEEKF